MKKNKHYTFTMLSIMNFIAILFIFLSCGYDLHYLNEIGKIPRSNPVHYMYDYNF